MNKNIVIVHYNTPNITECLVKSINLFVEDANIYIFDNSDKLPFTATFDNVTIIDNTQGQIIDFDKWLSSFKRKAYSRNKWASAKHCYSVEKCMELIDDNFILLDSDVLLKKDISSLYDTNCVYVADIEYWKGNKRVIPYCCFINTKKCKEVGIHFFNDKFIVGLTPGCKYDTGGYFYMKCKELHSKKINYNDYVVHMDNGSQLYKDNESRQKAFLLKNKKLYTRPEDDMKELSYKQRLKRFCADRHLGINIDSPKTIQDKINWLKVNNLTSLKTDCADKVKLHEYCEKTLGKDICTPIIKVYNSTSEINWDELPEKFVIKCNHGSGMNIIVNKSNFSKQDVISKLNRWMKTDFAFQNGFEMQYHDIERKIFVEAFLEDSTQQKSLYDYKFWCFNGVPHFFTINDGNGHGSWMKFYDMDCNPMNCKRTDFLGSPKTEVKIPSKFNEMVEYSKKLSEPFEFVRVDFYEVNGEAYLGEMTFTPGSGFFKYTDKSYDLKFGNLLNLNIPKSVNKKVVYTCITGGYDALIEPRVVSDGFDYICFTDNLNMESNVWTIKPLPKETEGLSQVKKQRYVKINAHLLLKDYDLSIWVDGNVDLKGDLNKFVNETLVDDVSVYVPTHPSRTCIYAEAKAVISMKKDTSENVKPQIERYKEEGFPANYGLLQSNIMLRKHNNEDCIRLMEAWFAELKDNSHRDQLSFNYALWKNDDVKVKYMSKDICKSKYFHWGCGHKRCITRRISKGVGSRQIAKNTNAKPTKTREQLRAEREHRRYVFKSALGRRISTYKVSIYQQ